MLMKAATISLFSVFLLAAVPAYSQAITPIKDDFGNILLDNISKKDIPKLIDFLGQHSPICIYASRSLVALGPDAVPELLDALKKGRFPRQVLNVLMQISDKRAADGLAAIIKDPSAPPVPVSTLSAYGDMAVPALAGLLSDDNKHGDAAAEVLCGISPSEGSMRSLRKCLDSAYQPERGRAALVLGQWRDFQSAPEIEELLFYGDVKVRTGAVKGYSALFHQAPERYDLKLLEKYIESENDFNNRSTAVDSLASIPGRKADYALLRVIRSEKNNKILSRILYDIGDRPEAMMAVPVLQIIQENGDPDVRAAGFYALGKFKAEEAVPYINGIMHTAQEMNPEMKLQAFEALTNIGRPVDFKDYLVHLYDTDGCDECYSFKDALLGLVAANVKPGDKETLAFLVSFKKVAAARFQEQIDSIIKKIGQ